MQPDQSFPQVGAAWNSYEKGQVQLYVKYLGHRVDAEGLHTTPDKLEAVVKAPAPKNVQELRSFLGLVNYYGKFLPNLATTLQPLNSLLQKDRKWKWTSDCSHAFQLAKDILTTSKVLVHNDPSLPMKMAADASAYGVGAVISHVLPDGTERPIAFASRTLTSSERNYAQLEKKLSLWGEAVPQIPLWAKVHDGHRP